MPKGESSVSGKRSAAQKSAAAVGKRNLEAGRLKTQAARKARKESGEFSTAGERWAMLLSGQITVRDLDDKEIKKMRVRGADGGFTGRPRALPSHLVQQFVAEQMRRMKDSMTEATPKVIKAMMQMVLDPDEPAAVRAGLGRFFIERALGKTPDVVRLEGASLYDAMLSEVLGVDRTDLEAEARAAGLKD